jgi:2-aminoadipate transaminase
VQLAEEYGFYIISDEPYNLLNFENTARHTPLYTGRSKQIISLGSFSKILSPGLRLGKYGSILQSFSYW